MNAAVRDLPAGGIFFIRLYGHSPLSFYYPYTIAPSP